MGVGDRHGEDVLASLAQDVHDLHDDGLVVLVVLADALQHARDEDDVVLGIRRAQRDIQWCRGSPPCRSIGLVRSRGGTSSFT